MKQIIEAIKDADEVEVDSLFCVLRDRKLGIYRKLKCMALILDIDEDEVLNEAIKDEKGRVLDHDSRHLLADALVVRAKQMKQNEN